MCFSFSNLCFGKNFELMGSDKIRTTLRSYRCIVCPSVIPLSLPLTESSNLEKNTHIWRWLFPLLCSHSWKIYYDLKLYRFFPVLCSHNWIIYYDLKWYRTSVVFTTVFHRALLSCRWQQSWIVSSVWCWLWDVQRQLFDQYSCISKYTPAFYRCRVSKPPLSI
jgi:hypothetical protein